jgi:hypothetical protein
MPRPLILTQERWQEIHQKIRSDYGPGMLIRSRCEQTLGFQCRYHERWAHMESQFTPGVIQKRLITEVHLDFSDLDRQTFFIMKYL